MSAQKDGDNIKLTKISGAQTTVGPFSGGGGGGGATSTTNYPTSALTTNGGGFSGTPPATITLTGSWGSNGWSSYADFVAAQGGSSYVRTTYTQDYALYDG